MDNRIQQSSDKQWPLGPTFPALQSRQRNKLILKYAWQHQRLQIYVAIVFITLVITGTIFWSELHFPATASDTPKGFIGWLINAQSILSFGTLLVALFVWWGETQEDWVNNLSKKLSVFFFFEDRPLIVCRYVWLAGADEIRTWGQQVAKQAQPSSSNQPNLDFYPDVETREPILLLGPKDEVWKHYSVCFRLSKLNSILNEYAIFSWDNVPGNDEGRLKEFLEKRYNLDWVKNAKIQKINKNKSIAVYTIDNFLSLNLNDEKTEVTFTIDNISINSLIAKKEKSDKLIIYFGCCRYQNLAEIQTDPKDILQKEVGTVSEVADWKATVSQKLPRKSPEIKKKR
ncbi:MAG: hypothetical protein PHS80_11310 [Methanothrix sp.]|nr:hypothetical protein [Methanothrix sp.]MDD4448311.1 hypothetical protein [Methanothrix sp.]